MVVDVFVERCESYQKEVVDKAVDTILSRIKLKLRAKPKILLKPNLLLPTSPKRAVTTHPAVVASVCKHLRKRFPDAKIFLGESSGCGGLPHTKLALEVCGINKAIKQHNITILPFESQPLVRVDISNGVVWKHLMLPKIVVEADLIVNLPKLKTHSLTMFTGAVKNLYGCLPGGAKAKGHLKAVNTRMFGELLIDIYSAIKPGLNLMDGVWGMEGQGPVTGPPKRTGYLLASTDAVALDAVALKLIGIKEPHVPTQVSAKRRGLYPKYRVIGNYTVVKYKQPSMLKLRLLNIMPQAIADRITKFVSPLPVNYPHIIPALCKKCYTCVRVCPVNAIHLKGNTLTIDYKKCINCLCCSENCMYNAIKLKQGWVFRGINSFKRLLRWFR
ncbi:hypothetical protein DRJ48_01780 [Candidatus Woesearchaeota archaeon]|nr:DUF362 domain-containing protein [Candidatus Woesearchaeota archaeon]RLE43122.1 MAG: hypothetical protein DRJ48_01780 [Candidatus Woesearchaeota archaeon]